MEATCAAACQASHCGGGGGGLPAIRADSAAADLAELAELGELAELVRTMSVFQTHARNTDSAQIRPYFRSLFGLSPMNADMSVFMAPP